MAQRPAPDGTALSALQESAQENHPVLPSSPELRLEQSRFSRLLARFGLGELTNPILRPNKQPADRDRAG
ncbi:MAG TPA: hypothetical protein VHG35_12060 [Gemmatimonadales bacterium]|nr:hypothetical protein [Gemmatimonadales bacterium]